MISVAIVGVGYWGPNLVRNMSLVPDVRIHAICDMDLKKADSIRRKFCPEATVVGDYKELAADQRVDAVVVATPIRTHYDVAAECLAAGKHVLVEKPLARTVDECRRLIELADRRRRVLMTGHVFLYNSVVRKIKGYIDEGYLGRLFYIYSQRVNLGRVQHDVNALWSFAPHDVSIVNAWLGQDPVRVSARGFSYISRGIEDIVFVILEYPNGVAVHLHLGWFDPRKIRMMTLVGSKRMLVYDDVSQDARIQIFDKGIDRLDDYVKSPETFAEFQFQIRQGDLVVPTVSFSEPLQTECQHFIDCIRSSSSPLSDGLNGLSVVRVLDAADRSIRQEGRPIDL